MVRRYISDELKEWRYRCPSRVSPTRKFVISRGSVNDPSSVCGTRIGDTGAFSRESPGRPRVLTAIEAKFLCDCVERQPDIALKELQTELRGAFDAETSLQTIARTLQRAGYIMKRDTPDVSPDS
ncbi:hypothetical protein EDB83DRAFT_2486590 [Lactarius deliciosus]|nr:hypothetical protein EDB83DRAFT_2486590 [Lactarius deliciosus]